MELQARVFTPHASAYLAGLVALWEHTYPVRHDALTAEINLSHAQLVLTADQESLSFRLVGEEPDGVCAARAIVERHLDRVRAEQAETGASIDWHGDAVTPSSGAAS